MGLTVAIHTPCSCTTGSSIFLRARRRAGRRATSTAWRSRAEGTGGLVAEQVERCRREFTEAVDDDLNLAGALGALFTWVREANAALDQGDPDTVETGLMLTWLEQSDTILDVLREEEDEGAQARVRGLVERRAQAKVGRDFAEADRLRLEIEELGWVVKDTPAGPVFHRR